MNDLQLKNFIDRRIAFLKQNHNYHESVTVGEEQNPGTTQREQSLQQQQLEEFEKMNQTQEVYLEDKDRMMLQRYEILAAGLQEIEYLREQLREHVGERDKIHKLTVRVNELELQLQEKNQLQMQQPGGGSGQQSEEIHQN